MPTKIIFKINYINDLLLFTDANNLVLVTKKDTTNDIPYNEYVYINSVVDNSLYKKEYFIIINYYDNYTDPLTKFNFIITFPLNISLFYEYIFSEQAIYIYKQNINIPFNMIGLINYNENLAVITRSILFKISGLIDRYDKVISLKNENISDKNFLDLPGNVQIINSLKIQNASNLSFDYYLFETDLPITISDLTKIYFYDPTFIRIINIPFINKNDLEVDTINVLVELIGSNGLVLYSYITNLNVDRVDAKTKSSYVLCFKNYVENIEFTSVNLKIFDYDYYIYFDQLVVGDYIKCNPITIPGDINLYGELIGNNTDIPNPIILNLDINYYKTNLNKNDINNIFNLTKDISNNLIENFLYSDKERFEILLDYLVKFNIKDYNFYNIKFFAEPYSQNNKIINFFNDKLKFLTINPSNVMLNAILSNIEIYFNDKFGVSKNYNIYGMIFNNNNSWDIYTKKYPLDNPTLKYAIIKDLLIMAINFYQIVIYNYSDINDLNGTKISSITNTGTPYINPYYRYNRLILNKDNSKLIFGLDEHFYLKLYIEIQTNYKMLIFYSNTEIPSSNTKVLNFKTNGFYNFKIYQISQPNGSTQINKYEYSILFQNIEECNDFIFWINYGKTIKISNINSTYFNIQASKFFNLDNEGFYVINDSTTSINSIFFRILDLDLNKGNVFVNNQIIQT